MFDKFRDECGVFGIFGHPEASNLAYLGLYALQHRGQESAGIAASDGQLVRVSKAMGYVNEAFDTTALAQASRSHGRRPRAVFDGGREPRSPTRSPSSWTACTVNLPSTHNGNIVNATELRDALVRLGAIFQATTDTEVIVHLFARSREDSVGSGDHRRAVRRCAAPIPS